MDIESEIVKKSAVFGGLALAKDSFENVETYLASPYAIEDFPAVGDSEDAASFLVFDDAAVVSASRPMSNIIPTRDGLLIYKVQNGDTLAKIAANFDISLNTILWANQSLRSGNLLQPGQEIVLLPVSGVLHKAAPGETLDAIASLYGVHQEAILKVNKNLETGVAPGDTIIIPGARPKKTLAASLINQLPNLSGYFALPTTGWNWGEIHPFNAVDIANACGTAIYAAAEGLVTRVGLPTSWNGGYGGFVEIEHPNRTVTRYAHVNKTLVSLGDYVSQKELVAEMGNSGNVKGAPGCHLHFEVEGARNPLAK